MPYYGGKRLSPLRIYSILVPVLRVLLFLPQAKISDARDTRQQPRSLIVRLFLVAFIGLLAASAALSGAPPETFYFFVFSNPTAAHEDEYNKWYNEQHALDVVAIPGFVTAQRFVMNDEQLKRVPLQVPRYLVVYKIVTDDLESVFAEVSRRLRTKETVMSPTFDSKTSVSYTYRNFRPEVKGVGGEPAVARPGPKRTYLQVVFTVPVAGREEEFNTWYDVHHAPDLAGSPGFVSAQRMILARPSAGSIPGTKYLAMFRIETSDIGAVLKTLAAQPSSGPSLNDPNLTRGYTFREIGPVIEGDKVRAARAISARAAK